MKHCVQKLDPVADHWYVENHGYWFVIRCSSKRIARRWGVQEFGKTSHVKVRPATRENIHSYIISKGNAILPLEDDPS